VGQFKSLITDLDEKLRVLNVIPARLQGSGPINLVPPVSDFVPNKKHLCRNSTSISIRCDAVQGQNPTDPKDAHITSSQRLAPFENRTTIPAQRKLLVFRDMCVDGRRLMGPEGFVAQIV
jgi:hypothetical protein